MPTIMRGWCNKATGERIQTGGLNEDLTEIAFSSMHIIEPRSLIIWQKCIYNDRFIPQTYSEYKYILWGGWRYWQMLVLRRSWKRYEICWRCRRLVKRDERLAMSAEEPGAGCKMLDVWCRCRMQDAIETQTIYYKAIVDTPFRNCYLY